MFSNNSSRIFTAMKLSRRRDMNIRYGNTEDAAMLTELGAKTFYDTYAKDNTPENIRLYMTNSFSTGIQVNELSQAGTLFLIAELEDKPVGYAKLRMNSRNESIRG